ncbi:MAG: hypothetical protein K1X57_13410, partial [Gemmataceae bacterium]|nr:hypothetical protein [Gemmataceae bacterium]
GGPPGPMARGGSDGPRGGPGMAPGMTTNPTRNSASPVWMLQFIDPTIEPGKCYRYRIQLKLTNPNYNKKDLVAYPGLAQQEELQSDWAEIPGVVACPPDEHLYAAGEKAKDRALIGTADFDTTTLRFHRWYDFVRVSKDAARGDVVAEWVVADVDAKRGQYVHQERSFKLPLWSMFTGSYIFRDRISVVGKGQSATVRAKMENVKMTFDTSEPVLVVDFDGGKGAYRLPNGNSLVDECAVETLLLSGIDGAGLRLELRNAATDKEDAERKAREESWQRWLEEVKNGPDPTPAGGTPRAG